MTATDWLPFHANTDGFWQLVFRLPRADVAAFEQAWMNQQALAISIEDYAEYALTHKIDESIVATPIFAEPEQPLADFATLTEPSATLWEDCVIQVLLAHDAATSTLMLAVLKTGASHTATLIKKQWLGSQDWLMLAQSSFQPIILDKLAVLANWHEEKADKTVIRIDPGQAFGSGAHHTTKMMLSWIEATPLKQKIVIDYGCGSGILAIAAVKMGATTFATDIDPIAMKVATDNCHKNNIDKKKCRILALEKLTQAVSTPNKCADIVLANILLRPLLSLSKTFHQLIGDNGKILMTGILTEQVDALKECYNSKNGWDKIRIIDSQSGWALVEAIKH